MRIQFGLRAKESLLSNKIESDKLIVQGSKGGRPRSIKISTQDQIDLIKRVQDHISANSKTSLIPVNLNLRQGLKMQSNVLHRIGGTKANDAHAHAARHRYAQNLAKQGATKETISENLGHSREEIVAHYVP